MKKNNILILLTGLAAGVAITAMGQPTNAADNGIPAAAGTNAAGAAAAATNQPATAPAKEPVPASDAATAASASQGIPQPSAAEEAASSATPAANSQPASTAALVPTGGVDAVAAPASAASNGGTNGLRLHFRNAPLELVLNYFSEAAGFIIALDARPRGTVDIWSNTPVTKEEAVNLLNQELKKNGFAAIRNGRTLTIVPRDEAKIHDIPVKVGSDPAAIPRNDEIVTQIIPVRFVEVAQLVKDLQPLISTQTTMTANESGNEIVITDTQANIHKVAEIIKAIDAGAEDMTVVRVFRLNYADPTEMSELLVNLFPDDSRSGGSSSPVQFGGGFGGGFRRLFGGGGPGGGGNNTSGGQNTRIKKRARVIAVPDPRTSSVVVSAAKDLMDQIDGVVAELDAHADRKKTVRVYKMDNADPQQAMQLLQDVFQNNGQQSGRNSANQNSVLQNRSTQQNNQNNSNTRMGGNSRGGGGGGNSFGP